MKVSGFGRSVPENIQDVLQTILNAADKPQGTISRAKFFDSGNTGVSFVIGGSEYVIVINPGRMGSDDYIRGSMSLSKTGSPRQILSIRGDDNLNSVFPSKADIGKIIQAVSNLI
jgi:hypothetical protein